MKLDRNNYPYIALDSFDVAKSVPTAFTGSANERGDKDGTQSAFTVFAVTGEVIVRVYGVCTATLVGAGTLELGITGNTALLIAQVSDATTIATADVWVDATVGEVRGVALSGVPASTVIVNGNDIIETTAGTDITSGNIYYICLWRPLSPDGLVTSSYPS